MKPLPHCQPGGGKRARIPGYGVRASEIRPLCESGCNCVILRHCLGNPPSMYMQYTYGRFPRRSLSAEISLAFRVSHARANILIMPLTLGARGSSGCAASNP